MELKTGEKTLEQIVDLNTALISVMTMSFGGFDTQMDLGLSRSSFKSIISTFEEEKGKDRLNVMKEFGVDENDTKLSFIKKEEIENKINENLKNAYKKKYKITYPLFQRSELKKWIDKDKDSDDKTAFKPNALFYQNIQEFIAKEE